MIIELTEETYEGCLAIVAATTRADGSIARMGDVLSPLTLASAPDLPRLLHARPVQVISNLLETLA